MATLPQHVLVVDDDPQIGDLLSQFLGSQGFRVTAAEDGKAMRKAIAENDISVVVLDLMLPGEDGLSLLQWLRATTSLPVIMLTAMDAEADRVVGLEMGADDYLTKPFSTRELLARIRAVLRRTTASAPVEGTGRCSQTLVFNGWILNTAHRTLHSADGVQVDLTSGEFDLLLVFLQHPQQVLNRDHLLELARGRVSGPLDRTIDVQVGKLRQKLEAAPKNPELIKTIRGGGYMLTCEVHEQEKAPPE
ncbi:transcriptional regulatory protein OmpR [mine drainage metagenome]|uniref:Transcriptional regulatory protein OmpR n=1 Tax=mine drainage metagenome TaxID=410659 RepID=A0A1J5RWM9_9ZZZZ